MRILQLNTFADPVGGAEVYMLSLRAARTISVHRLPAREVAVVSLGTAALLGVVVGLEGQSLAIPTVADAGWLVAYGVLSHCMGWLLITYSLPKVLYVIPRQVSCMIL